MPSDTAIALEPQNSPSSQPTSNALPKDTEQELNSPPKLLDTNVDAACDASLKTLPRLVVGVVGLPSAGKSTLINSIIGKRILHTGVCRTTKEVHLIGPENTFNLPAQRFHEEEPTCDDGVQFTVCIHAVC